MDFTVRDGLTVLGLFFTGLSVYVRLGERLTRLEALKDRVEKVENAVGDLEANGGKTREQLAGMQAELHALGRRVDEGIAAVLDAVRSLRSGDRRGGGAPA